MKLYKLLVVAFCWAGLTSCDDFFDVTPKDQLTNETFWKNPVMWMPLLQLRIIGG